MAGATNDICRSVAEHGLGAFVPPGDIPSTVDNDCRAGRDDGIVEVFHDDPPGCGGER